MLVSPFFNAGRNKNKVASHWVSVPKTYLTFWIETNYYLRECSWYVLFHAKGKGKSMNSRNMPFLKRTWRLLFWPRVKHVAINSLLGNSVSEPYSKWYLLKNNFCDCHPLTSTHNSQIQWIKSELISQAQILITAKSVPGTFLLWHVMPLGRRKPLRCLLSFALSGLESWL